jgi:hypothetical protein
MFAWKNVLYCGAEGVGKVGRLVLFLLQAKLNSLIAKMLNHYVITQFLSNYISEISSLNAQHVY